VSPPKGSQMSPPVLAPEQPGVPPSAVEQNDEHVPPLPMMRQVLPGAHSFAAEQLSPGFLLPAPAHCEPVKHADVEK